MQQADPDEIVRNAIERDELSLLLLGAPEYAFLPRSSSCPYSTDLMSLLSSLYAAVGPYPRDRLRESLLRAIRVIVTTYEGLIPVAGCILFESGRRWDSRPGLDLPLEELAASLRASIVDHKPRLVRDTSGTGWQFEDGLLGDLRRLSKNTEDVGGPSFA